MRTNPVLAVESVEKSHQKSIELKPEPKEAPRSKSSGKPPRVFPTFDINPHVAREFLERCRAEDSELDVDFQKPAEEYTPWKNLKEQEEKQKASETRPVGYAAALLAKHNIVVATVETPKGRSAFPKLSPRLSLTTIGPVKPKLVARGAGGLKSAWKKTIPTISADGISASARPILGYTLWRLHERETYSFVKDASILLTDDKELAVAAKKAGISAKTFDFLHKQLAALISCATDLNLRGDVEQDFPQDDKPSENGHRNAEKKVANMDAKVRVVEQIKAPGSPSQNDAAVSDAKEDGVEAPKDPEPAVVQIEPERIDAQEPSLETTARLDMQTSDETPEQRKKSEELDAEEPPLNPSTQAQVEAIPPKPRAWADVVSNRIRPIEERYPNPPALSTPEVSDVPMNVSDASIDTMMAQVNQDEEKASIIMDWIMKAEVNMHGEPNSSSNRSVRRRSPRNKKTEKPSPPKEAPAKPFRPILLQRGPQSSQATSEKAPAISEKALSPSPPPSVQPANEAHTAVEVSPVENAAATKSTSEEALSPSPPPSVRPADETQTVIEVPTIENADVTKSTSQHRSTDSSASSAQTAVSKDTSIAKSVPIDEPMDSEEEVVVFIPSAKRLSAQQQTPKPAAEEKAAHTGQKSDGKPIHSKQMSIEEPRNLQQASPGRPIAVNHHRQPKPRAPVIIDPDAFGRDLPANPQTSHQNGSHRPHSRPNSQHGPSRPVAQHGQFRGGARGGRPFINPQTMPSLQNAQNIHPNFSMRGRRHHQMPQMNGQNGHVATNQDKVTVNGHAAPHFSPHNSPRVSPQRNISGKAPEPDGDFYLQSGAPRGSTRGKGRLWIP